MRQQLQGMAELMRQQQQSLQQVQQLLLQHLQKPSAAAATPPPAAAGSAAGAASAHDPHAGHGGRGCGDTGREARQSCDATPARSRQGRDQVTDLASKSRAAGDSGSTSSATATRPELRPAAMPQLATEVEDRLVSHGGPLGRSVEAREPAVGPTSQGPSAASATQAAGRLPVSANPSATGTTADAWATGVASKAAAAPDAAGAASQSTQFSVGRPCAPAALALGRDLMSGLITADPALPSSTHLSPSPTVGRPCGTTPASSRCGGPASGGRFGSSRSNSDSAAGHGHGTAGAGASVLSGPQRPSRQPSTPHDSR